jgi:heterotetrameric sarcosine oxidase gamma subunit
VADTQATPVGAQPNAALVRSAARSPFAGHADGERPNRSGEIGVRINAGLLPGVVLVSTWISGINGLLSALASVFGNVPQRTGLTASTPLGLLARTGPEEFLLLSTEPGNPTAQLRQAIAADIGAVTDLSHARCRIHIEGPRCQTVLNKLFALDLRADAFPVGEVRLTGTHHVPCVLHRLGADSFDMLVFSTYAYDQLHTLVDAALEYGVGVTLE